MTHVHAEPLPFTAEATPAPTRVDHGATPIESPATPYSACAVCASRRPDGSLADLSISHCRHCHRTWSRTTRQAHCATCHEHFTTPGNFDLHLAPVNWLGDPCRSPKHVTTKTGEARLRLRDDGVWTGAGEYDRDEA